MRSTYIRDQKIDDIGPWFWLEGDNGTWDGPSENWPNHIALWTKHIKQYRTCIQAGGALGMYPKLLAKKFRNVITFEPSTESFEVLKLNCSDPNIAYHNFALGAYPGYVKLQYHQHDNVGANSLAHNVESRPVGESIIKLIPLDDLNIIDVDFIQLDVENYEINVLRGAEKLIERYRPVISCENGNGQIEEFLRKYGYQSVGKSHADTCYATDTSGVGSG